MRELLDAAFHLRSDYSIESQQITNFLCTHVDQAIDGGIFLFELINCLWFQSIFKLTKR